MLFRSQDEVPVNAMMRVVVSFGDVDVGSILLPPGVNTVTCHVTRHDDARTVVNFRWWEE